MDAENRKPESRDLDRWLDAALRERANAEPRSGLEQRVLARLATQSPKQQFVWWQMWAAAAAIFVIALTLSLLYPRRHDQVVNEQPQRISPERKTNSNEPTAEQRQRPARSAVASGRDRACCLSKRTLAKNGPAVARNQPEPLPKLTKFPTPHPETPQERLLVQLATQPQGIEVANISNDGMPLKELSIPELKTEPMEGTPPDAVRRDEFGRKDASQEHR